MASMMKFSKMEALAVIAHQERTCLTHSNENIDPERTKDNYSVWPPDRPDQVGEKHGWQRLQQRLDQVKHLNRSDVNVLVEWVIHLGPDVPPGYENEKAFFEACMRYCVRKYGAENICYGIVHKDEETPHLTVGFVPVVRKAMKLRKNASAASRAAYEEAVASGNTTVEVLDADSIITRKHLQDWHGGLTQHLINELGYDPAVNTGITEALGGNVSVKQLKKMPSNWRENRNKFVKAFHSSRRAAVEGRKPALNDTMTLSGPKPQERASMSPPPKGSSLDAIIGNAKNRSGER